MDANRFYIYLFLREDGTPYYVGKGQGRRQWQKNRTTKLPADPARNVRILDGMSEEDAFAWEQTLITRYGRKDNGTGILRNLTDGGDGVSGLQHSEETKERMSSAHKGKSMSKSHYANYLSTIACRSDSHYDALHGRNNHQAVLRIWQHPEHGTHELLQSELVQRFPGLQQGNLAKVVAGKIRQHKGWACLTPEKTFAEKSKANGNKAAAKARLANNAAKLGMAAEEYAALPPWTRKRRLAALRNAA